MFNNSVTKRFLISVTILAATAVPAIGIAGEQSDETGNVVGSAVEAANMPEISSAITPSEVVISQEVNQESGARGAVSPSEATP